MGDGEDECRSYEGTTVVLCLGNRYMGDDGVGPEVSRRLRGMELGPLIVIRDSLTADLATVWEFRAARRLIVVDAVRSGDRPGTVTRHSLLPRTGQAKPLPGLHGLDLSSAIDAASPEGVQIDVVVVGVEPKDCAAGQGLTPEVEAAVPTAVSAVLAELGSPSPGSRPPKAN